MAGPASSAILASSIFSNELFADSYNSSPSSLQTSSNPSQDHNRNPFSPVTPAVANSNHIPQNLQANEAPYNFADQWGFIQQNGQFNQQHQTDPNNGSYTPSYHSHSEFGSSYDPSELPAAGFHSNDGHPQSWRASKRFLISLCPTLLILFVLR